MKLDNRNPLARARPARARRAVCRICLAPETEESSLVNGICRDREACEQRQPPLITREESAT